MEDLIRHIFGFIMLVIFSKATGRAQKLILNRETVIKKQGNRNIAVICNQRFYQIMSFS